MQHLTRTFTCTLALILFSPAVWGQRTLELDRVARSAARTAGTLPLAKPEDAGMSSAKLLQAAARADTLIAEKKLAGAIVMVARHGKVVHRSVHGQMDIEAGKPMRENTIFRIYSMSKPIVSVAAMMLQEEGKLALDAPIARYLPEMADLVLYKEGGNVVPSRQPIVADLLRHSAGLTYGIFGNTPVDRLYREEQILDGGGTLADMTGKLGKIPLLYDPGTDWVYSVATDVTGRLVEVVSGKPLDVFLRARIFAPLNMPDTAFWVPEGKVDRFAATYGPAENGGLQLVDAPSTSRFARPTKFFSGGGGLVSTAHDYMRFVLMLVNGGTLDGQRLLQRTTLEQMTANQLPEKAMPVAFGPVQRTGIGFGFGFSVIVKKSPWDPAGRIGEYGWGGAASTHFWISPADDLAVITLEQTMPYSPLLESALKGPIYDAILTPPTHPQTPK
jgi:CubicO group peptidase (beta-lactamase class C family)